MITTNYNNSLQVNGQSYKKFRENQSKILKTWLFPLEGEMMRVVLEKDTLDVWVNGEKLDTAVSHFFIIIFWTIIRPNES